MTILWSFSYNPFVKFHSEKLEATKWLRYIQGVLYRDCTVLPKLQLD